jgi:hypothetical protein
MNALLNLPDVSRAKMNFVIEPAPGWVCGVGQTRPGENS